MKFLLFLLATCTGGLCYAQSLTEKDALWQQVDARNKAFAQTLTDKDIAKITGFYTNTAELMPEHSQLRHGSENIRDYYSQWFAGTQANQAQKTIYEIQDLGNYALETGTFILSFDKINAGNYKYVGKYLTIWKKPSGTETELKIAAQIWGANAGINDSDFPDIDDSKTISYDIAFDTETYNELKERNAKIAKLVSERKGAEHAKLFMNDAIYMTYYTPMLVGMNKIEAYFTEHEKPGTLKIEDIAINNGGAIKVGKNIIIEFGSYKVDWSDGDAKGTVTGKSINVWKRDAAGTLMLYRQMVNHD